MPAMPSEQGRVGAGRRRRCWPRALRLAPLGVLLLGAGCATMTKHDWLCFFFFFDGVPGAPGSTQPPAPGAGADDAPVVLRSQPAPTPAPLPVYRHAPYADDECTACHESKFSQRIKQKPKDLCFTCHDDFLAKAKVKHAPAEGGECLACHNPHQSENKHLLRGRGRRSAASVTTT
ncbi:MAG: cytochrome c3 family protein [Kiritimatiellaeota bacterium]|nr:cytochrome c3 family protein [Kiritimatiellota bacterium]